jgi:hypothetical protein
MAEAYRNRTCLARIPGHVGFEDRGVHQEHIRLQSHTVSSSFRIKNRRRSAHAQATRTAARRAKRYPSDLTDAQWQVIAPGLPEYVPGRRGRPPVWPGRRTVEGILYVDRTGCAWRYLPADFPPFLWNQFCQESSGCLAARR